MTKIPKPVAHQFVMNVSPQEYHRKIAEFANGQMNTFLMAGKASAEDQHAEKHLEALAKATGRELNELRLMTGIDAKFSSFAGVHVAVNVLRLMPEDQRGMLLAEALDYLVLNCDLGEERIKEILVGAVMSLGRPTEEVMVDAPEGWGDLEGPKN